MQLHSIFIQIYLPFCLSWYSFNNHYPYWVQLTKSRITDGSLDQNFDLEKVKEQALSASKHGILNYTSFAWPFCHFFESGSEVYDIENFSIHYDYSSTTDIQDLEDLYCSKYNVRKPFSSCPVSRELPDTTNCSLATPFLKMEKLNGQYCFIKDINTTFVIFSFPMEDFYPDEFGPCESSEFITGFNKEFEIFHKELDKIELYGINFDLAILEKHTTPITKEVIVRADTVYMSKDMVIKYKLKIRARFIFINKKLDMLLDMSTYRSSQANHVVVEKHYKFKQGLKMRHKSFGLVDIFDTLPLKRLKNYKWCKPLVEEAWQAQEILHRFDNIQINLNCICARTLSRYNPKLAWEMADWNLIYLETFNLADPNIHFELEKFRAIKEMARSKAHPIPPNNLGELRSMANFHYNTFQLLWKKIEIEDGNLSKISNRYFQISNKYEAMIEQLQNFHRIEQRAIEDRREISDSLQASFESTSTHIDFLKKIISQTTNNTKAMIADLQNSLIKDALEQTKVKINQENGSIFESNYENQLLLAKMKKSMEVQNRYQTDLKGSRDKMRKSLRDLGEEAKNAKKSKTFWDGLKLAFQVISTGFELGLAIATMEVPGLNGIMAAASSSGLFNLAENVKDFVNTQKSMNLVYNMTQIDEMSLDKIGTLTDNFDFIKSLEKLSKLKGKSTEWANIEYDVVEYIKDVAHEFDLPSRKPALKSTEETANLQRALLKEMIQFSDDLMKYLVSNSTIHVQIKNLENNLKYEKHLESTQDFFTNRQKGAFHNMKKVLQRYDDETKKLKDDYRTLMDFQYKERIKQNNDYFQHLVVITKQWEEKKKYIFQEGAKLILMKKRKMQEDQMTDRLTLMEFFADFCDVKFYQSFERCNAIELPTMIDTYPRLLEKIISLQNITFQVYGGLIHATEFSDYFYIKETEENLPQFERLREIGKATFNFSKYISNLDSYSKFRIKAINVAFAGRDRKFLPKENSDHNIATIITPPRLFEDLGPDLRLHTFYAEDEHHCSSTYKKYHERIKPVSSCTMMSQYGSDVYQPSPRGNFTIVLRHFHGFKLDDIRMIKVDIDGSRIDNYHLA